MNGEHRVEADCRGIRDLPGLLRCFRERRLWTQAMLAERSGVPEKTISSLETGARRRPHLSTLDLIAAALDLDDADRARLRALRQAPGTAVEPEQQAVVQPVALPIPATSFLGRDQTVRQLLLLLRRPEVRLLTLTGPGGIGKTRLAQHLAAQVAAEFSGGAHFVDLAPLTDFRLVPNALAQALAIPSQGFASVEEAIVASLRDRHLLLILDNAEQILASRAFIDRVLAASPLVSVLVTSRERLGILREHVFQVAPLAVPPPGRPLDVATARDVEAVSLFVQRAQAVDAAFALTDANAGEVAELCRRLDGIPLAIELAAARIVHFGTPRALLGHLDNRLTLLRHGTPDRPQRHRTMHDAIDWSYSQLAGPERQLFQCLASTAGGATLAAVEAIYGDTQRNEGSGEPLALRALFSLIDKSLAQHIETNAGDSRYVMLDTLRQFGQEQLAANPAGAAIRQRHAEFFLHVAEQGEAQLAGERQEGAVARLKADQDNLREALNWLIHRGDADLAMRLGSALWRFWSATGRLHEGRDWLRQAVALPDASAAIRAKALLMLGHCAVDLADYREARRVYEESLALAQAHDDVLGAERALGSLGLVAWNQGRYDEARAAQEELLRARRERNALAGAAVTLQNLGSVSLAERDFVAARQAYEESLRIRQELGNEIGVGYASYWLAVLARLEGQHAEAQGRLERALHVFRALGDASGEAMVLLELGWNARTNRGDEAPLALFATSLLMRRDAGDSQGAVECVESIAVLAADRGRYAESAFMFGAADAWRRDRGAPLIPPLLDELRDAQQEAQRAIGGERFAAAWSSGAVAPLERAIQAALDLDLDLE